MALCKYEIERMSEKEINSLGANLGENPYLTETAGFVPLDVKLRRFQESGQLMQFNVAEFTSSDYRQAYFSPDYEITPEDDLEEIQEKLLAREEFMKKIKKAKSKGNNEFAGTDEPKKSVEDDKTSKKNSFDEAADVPQ